MIIIPRSELAAMTFMEIAERIGVLPKLMEDDDFHARYHEEISRALEWELDVLRDTEDTEEVPL